jgi:uncharacterized protein YdhG (YjbR/CyaY superfamily)
MAKTKLKTVDEYIAALPENQRAVIKTMRAWIKKHLPKGYEESMTWGVPSYEIPLKRYPNTYNSQPMGYLALAARKNSYTLHMMSVYANKAQLKKLQDAFKKAGKKLDMGKACIHFKQPDDLPLDEMGKMIASVPVDKYIACIDAARKAPRGSCE